MPEKVGADMIKRALGKRHIDEVYLTEVKTGPTWYARPGELKRLDAVAIKKSWTNPRITGYEVKVSRSDWLKDEKWPGYRDYCHRLYIACPSGLIQPTELAEDVGLVWYYPETDKAAVRKAALFREVEVPASMFYHLLISHTTSDRHPFFSSAREYFEALRRDKDERRKLGHYVAGQIAETLRSYEEEALELRRRAERAEEKAAKWDRVDALLQGFGVNTWRGWEDKLRQLLTSKVPPQAVKLIQRLSEDASKLQSLVATKEEKTE